MLNQRTGCMGPSGEDAEQEAEDFAALLIYRLGRLPSDRSSIVQVRLGGVWLIVWVIAGLLGMATGLRIGWALVNKRSVVSSAMIVALGNLALVAAFNWPPLTVLIDRALHWPNISVGLSQVALVGCAAGSCVMITSVASPTARGHPPDRDVPEYVVAAVIAATTLVLFFGPAGSRRCHRRSTWAVTPLRRAARCRGCSAALRAVLHLDLLGRDAALQPHPARAGPVPVHPRDRADPGGHRLLPDAGGRQHPPGRHRHRGDAAGRRHADRRAGLAAARDRGLVRRPTGDADDRPDTQELERRQPDVGIGERPRGR